MFNFDAIIVGAGASGLITAVTAARRGKNILLIEKNENLGKKILYTGNGRCNLTNENVTEDCRKPVHYHGQNPKFAMSPLNKFGLDDTLTFFNELGLEFIKESDGRYFPSSDQAQSVVDVLKFEVENLPIAVIDSTRVTMIEINRNTKNFEIFTFRGKTYFAPKLVLATGGQSYPVFGSSGDGFEFAKSLGHKIVPTFPAYVPINVNSPICQKCQGTKVETRIKVFADGKLVAENTGVMLFTHFGLSAPAILELSREISYQISILHKKAELEINFLPNVKLNELDEYFINKWSKSPNKTVGFSFTGTLPRKLLPAILETEGIDASVKCREVSRAQRQEIIKLLTQYKFEVESTRGFEEAHFTAGGVDTKEIDPQTLESKLVPGLYFCGEIMDIDGDCGGYNLQWAWSTGAVVGEKI
jgi:hypothetical protein